MPAKLLFALGVGHVRRRGIEPGSRADVLADRDRSRNRRAGRARVARARLRSSASSRRTKSSATCGRARAREAGVELDEFYRVAEALHARGVIGRFSTFLEHVKPTAGNAARDALQRAVPLGGAARPRNRRRPRSRPPPHHDPCVLARRRPEFHNVNVMGVAHGLDKEPRARAQGGDRRAPTRSRHRRFGYTNVFWGGRSEIKPSEISPLGLSRVLRRARDRSGEHA